VQLLGVGVEKGGRVQGRTLVRQIRVVQRQPTQAAGETSAALFGQPPGHAGGPFSRPRALLAIEGFGGGMQVLADVEAVGDVHEVRHVRFDPQLDPFGEVADEDPCGGLVAPCRRHFRKAWEELGGFFDVGLSLGAAGVVEPQHL